MNFENRGEQGRPCIVVHSFAEAYVANQVMTELYSGAEGLKTGTIFPELNIPYMGRDAYMGRRRGQ